MHKCFAILKILKILTSTPHAHICTSLDYSLELAKRSLAANTIKTAISHRPRWKKPSNRQSLSLLQSPSFDLTMALSMLVRYQDWKCKTILVTDSDSPENILYSIDSRWSKPHVVVKSASGTEIGNATFHALSSKVDFVFRDKAIEVKRKSVFSPSYTCALPSLQGGTVTFKVSAGQTQGFKLSCLDDKALPVARSSGASFGESMNSIGNLEIAEQYAKRQDVRDEIIVIALSLTHPSLTG